VFERFTDRARRVLVLAQEEARLLDHRFIGTEHMLLGILRLEEGTAADALASLGIRLDAVRTKVAQTVAQAQVPPTGAPPFTPRAKKVFELSVREALQQGHAFISEADILLGLLREGEGVAVQVMVSFGPDIAQIRDAVVERVNRSAPSGAHESQTDTSGDVELHCPYCRASIRDAIRYESLKVQPADSQQGGPVWAKVPYCNQCKCVLPVHL